MTQVTGDRDAVNIKLNYICNFNGGVGIILDQSTATIRQCIVRDNTAGGIRVQSSLVKSYVDVGEMPNDFDRTKYMTQRAQLNMANNFRMVRID